MNKGITWKQLQVKHETVGQTLLAGVMLLGIFLEAVTFLAII
jgi:hypothetical protein